MGGIAVMQIQKVRRAVTGFEHGEIFLAEMRVSRFPGMQGKEKRKVGVVRVEEIEIAKVEGVVAGNGGEKRIQQVVAFVVELGVVNAEDFVELRGGAFHRGKIEVVQDDTQGKLAEVVAVQFDLLDALAELAHLRFLGIVEQHILRCCIVQIDLAHERPLGVVKVAAFGLDGAAGLAGFFFLPFGHDVIVGANVEKPFEQQRKGVRRGLLERENLDEVVVHAQIGAMTFKVRFAQIVVKEGVVLERRGIEFQRIEIQRAFQHPKRFLLSEQAHGDKVADLGTEAVHLLPEGRFRLPHLEGVEAHRRVRGKPRREFRPGPAGIAGEFQQRLRQRAPGGGSGAENDKIDRKCKKLFGFFFEIGHAVADRRIDNGFAAEGMRNGLAVAFEQELIHPVVLIKQAQGGFEALGQRVHCCSFETLIIDTAHFENDADVS